MGAREDNYLVGLHGKAGWPGSVRVIVHHFGDRQINSVVSVSASRWDDLTTAAIEGDVEFFGALSDAVPSDFLSEIGPGGIPALRKLFLDVNDI